MCRQCWASLLGSAPSYFQTVPSFDMMYCHSPVCSMPSPQDLANLGGIAKWMHKGEVSWSQPVQYQLLYLWCKTLAQGMRPVVSSDSPLGCYLLHYPVTSSRIKNQMNNKRRAVCTLPPTSSWFSWKDVPTRQLILSVVCPTIYFGWTMNCWNVHDHFCQWSIHIYINIYIYSTNHGLTTSPTATCTSRQLFVFDSKLSNAEVELIPDIPK